MFFFWLLNNFQYCSGVNPGLVLNQELVPMEVIMMCQGWNLSFQHTELVYKSFDLFPQPSWRIFFNGFGELRKWTELPRFLVFIMSNLNILYPTFIHIYINMTQSNDVLVGLPDWEPLTHCILCLLLNYFLLKQLLRDIFSPLTRFKKIYHISVLFANEETESLKLVWLQKVLELQGSCEAKCSKVHWEKPES